MKTFFKAAIAAVLALVLLAQAPARAYAQEVNTKDYISEVKIAMGSGAEDALKGYTILSDENGDAIDLNKGAGGDWGSQGDRRVILGYKTTKKQSEAITDLAVMNMKGGYDVQEYEALIQQRMDSQVIPFIQKFQTTINEYRENINSDDDVNRARAEYVRASLNKFTDDDCGGAGLGDLLLNTTKFEMGDEAYNALSEADKKLHCDILTMFMQADGQLMLMVYALLTKAADTSEESWIDRLSGLTYDDLLASYDMSETDAKIQMDKDFQDDARLVLRNWDKLHETLLLADDYVEKAEKVKVPNTEVVLEYAEKLNEKSSDEDFYAAYYGLAIGEVKGQEILDAASAITVADYLESIDYEDGTLYDFFTKSSNDIEKDLTVLYPMIASLSEGQRAGLEFISLRELVMAGDRDTEYDLKKLEKIVKTSVYEGVDRGIYEKGGVALTWDARRSQALEADKNLADRRLLSTRTIVLWAMAGAAVVGFVGSVVAKFASSGGSRVSNLAQEGSQLWAYTENASVRIDELTQASKLLDDIMTDVPSNPLVQAGSDLTVSSRQIETLNATSEKVFDELTREENYAEIDDVFEETKPAVAPAAASSNTAAWMAVGFAAAGFVLAGVSLYLTWSDMKDYYKVDFSPIPHYMVDETAITYYVNKVKMVKENHAAYYKAVTCANRTDKKYVEILEDCADLNGDVGQQWLALYACWNNKVAQPILADSLKVVVGSSEIPAGYTTGIHMFGGDTAFNLNNKMYVWNQSAKSIYVYFQIDKDAKVQEASTSGSSFTGGWIALTAILGVAVGAVVTAVSMTAIRKKKERAAEA